MSICPAQVHQDLAFTVDEEGFFAYLGAAETPPIFFLPGLTSSLQSSAAQVRQIAAQTDPPVCPCEVACWAVNLGLCMRG